MKWFEFLKINSLHTDTQTKRAKTEHEIWLSFRKLFKIYQTLATIIVFLSFFNPWMQHKRKWSWLIIGRASPKPLLFIYSFIYLLIKSTKCSPMGERRFLPKMVNLAAFEMPPNTLESSTAASAYFEGVPASGVQDQFHYLKLTRLLQMSKKDPWKLNSILNHLCLLTFEQMTIRLLDLWRGRIRCDSFCFRDVTLVITTDPWSLKAHLL